MPYNRGSLILSLTLPLLLTAVLTGWRQAQLQPPQSKPKRRKKIPPKPTSPEPPTPAMAAKALALKEEGNQHFQSGNYHAAETLYTHALAKSPSNPKLLTNRAMARLKLARHDACIDDCLASIALEPKNLKAYYLLAQAQLALHHPNEAHSSALTAYQECVRTRSASTAAVSGLVLQSKKEKWAVRERERVRRRSALLAELTDTLRTSASSELSALSPTDLPAATLASERAAIAAARDDKITELEAVFAAADPSLKRREVPDYLVDNISFGVMHDPVITPSGHSYERATVKELLRGEGPWEDPVSRERMGWEDVRSNLGLRAVCEEFLEREGWAVDW